MKVLILTAAGSASIDQGTNQLSIFNILEQVSAAQFPIAIPNVTLCVLLSRDLSEPSKQQLSISLLNQDSGKSIFQSGFEADFQTFERTRIVASLPPLAVETPGRVNFVLKAGKKVLAIWPVAVTQLPQSQQIATEARPGETRSKPPTLIQRPKTKKKRKRA